MQLGIQMFSTDQTVGPVQLGQMVAEHGFESLFLPEHTHIPASRRSAYPSGGDLPPEYYRVHDNMVALSAAAVAAPGLTVGTGISIVAQHDPIVLAKQVASLDHVSEGRFVFGIGFGWNSDEMENHGTKFAARHQVTRDRVLAMKALWATELASFHGQHTSFEDVYLWPKPWSDPHPPILIGGGAGPKIFDHIAEYADGWMPIGLRTLSTGLPALQRRFEEVGRDPAEIRLHAFDPRPEARVVESYRDLGVERLILSLPPMGAGELRGYLEQAAPLVDVASG